MTQTSDGRPVQGGAAQPVYVVNEGTTVQGGAAQPVYITNEISQAWRSRRLTIGGVARDLSADRSWTNEALAPRVVTLLCGGDDETVASSTNCTTGVDTTNYRVGDRALSITTAGAVTATVVYDPLGPTDPWTIPPASAIGAWIYVPDSTRITSITIELYSNSGLSAVWSRSATGLVNGWNLWRARAVDGTLTGWGTIYRLRLVVVTSAATSVTIGHVWAECPEKAAILFIEDGGYASFLATGYPALRARNIPVTWAIDPALLGTGSGAAARIVEADLAALSPLDSIGLHGWDGAATAAMTAAQIRTDTLKAIRWLSSRGHYGGRLWRAAWVQNSATNASAAQPYLLAYATPSSTASLECWPFTNRWNVPRLSLHGRSAATVDGWFDQLQQTHSLLVVYTHGIDAAGGNNTTPAEWAYFLGKVDAAIAAGWLEGVTFEDLLVRSGARIRSAFGGLAVEYMDETGAVVQKRLP